VAAEGVFEGAHDVAAVFCCAEVANAEGIDFEPEFCFPVGVMERPAVEVVEVLLAAFGAQPVFDVGEGVVVEGGVGRREVHAIALVVSRGILIYLLIYLLGMYHKAISPRATPTTSTSKRQPTSVTPMMNRAKISPAERGRSWGSRYSDDR
jgi:hypothetical protein